MADTNRDIFIALIDAGLDESTILSFIEGASVDAAGIVEALGTDAHLAELVWQLRADRQALMNTTTPTVTRAQTESMVGSVLDQELADEFDAEALAEIERSGRAGAGIHKPAHAPVKVRRARRIPSRARRITFALASAAIVVLVLSVALPRIDLTTSTSAPGNDLAQGPESADPPVLMNQSTPTDDLGDTSIASQRPTVGGPTILSRPMERPIMVTSAAEALELARQGRLVLRVVGSRAGSTERLSALLSGQGELSRFATVDGLVEESVALALLDALPERGMPVLASAEEPKISSPLTDRQHKGTYMLRVEPSERAFSLLLAKLRNETGSTLELVGTVRPVTTPASAAGVTSLAGEPASWRSRISVPVVVEAIK